MGPYFLHPEDEAAGIVELEDGVVRATAHFGREAAGKFFKGRYFSEK